MRYGRKRAVLVFAAFLVLTGGNARAQGSAPNIVMADDLGYGDVGYLNS